MTDWNSGSGWEGETMRLFEGTEFFQPPRCEKCGSIVEDCRCAPPEPEQQPPEKQTARIRVEKRKKGKVVTVIRGLAAGNPGQHLANLLTRLKNDCGAGGTIQDGAIEIQGDHEDRIQDLLRESGYNVRG
jgi:translation initiation factor 1